MLRLLNVTGSDDIDLPRTPGETFAGANNEYWTTISYKVIHHGSRNPQRCKRIWRCLRTISDGRVFIINVFVNNEPRSS